MPLPTDEGLLALSQELLNQFDTIFGRNLGFRPAHAKGTLLTGMFTPSANAASLTRAPHIENASTPVTVRFSDSSGIPLIPDTDPNANPHGCAIGFNLAPHVHTDIVAHSTDGVSDQHRARVSRIPAGARNERSQKSCRLTSGGFSRHAPQGTHLRADAKTLAVQLCAKITSVGQPCNSQIRMASANSIAIGSFPKAGVDVGWRKGGCCSPSTYYDLGGAH